MVHLPADLPVSIPPLRPLSLHYLLHLSYFKAPGTKGPERERERDLLFTGGAKCSEQVRVRMESIVGGRPGDKSSIQMRPAVYNG